MEQYLCVRRRKKEPITIEQYLCVWQREKKPIGCLIGLGNLPDTELLSGVTCLRLLCVLLMDTWNFGHELEKKIGGTGRVGENSIYKRPSPSRVCGRQQPPLHW